MPNVSLNDFITAVGTMDVYGQKYQARPAVLEAENSRISHTYKCRLSNLS